MLVIKHIKTQSIKMKEEVLAYPLSSLWGDGGGTVGIIVGVSFWSFYGDFISPMFNNVVQKLKL